MTVAVIGSVNLDVIARVPRIPEPGETLLATGSSRGGGGKGANQAVAAARAGGVPVAFVGAVGDDGDGELLRGMLSREGIDVTGLATVEEPTGVALISVSDDGENTIVVIPGANSTVASLSDAQRDIVARADVVVAQLEIPVEGVLEAAAARRASALLVLNASPAAPLTDPAVARRLLAATDVLIVNEHELREITRDDGDAAIRSLATHVQAVVVTLGAAGAIVAVGEERRRVPAIRVDVVDTTGAGDTYCGVLAAWLSERRGDLTADALADAARVAAAAAALGVGRVGAQDAVPTRAELLAFLESAR